jgi:hypothetical protein
LYYQAADGIDLFMGDMDFHPNEVEAGKMLSVGTSQLEASARQLVASSQDASLSQACCLAAELILKAVLLENGMTEPEIISLGHNIPKLCAAVAKRLSGPNDAEFFSVAGNMPKYVAVRYSPPTLTIKESQELYRRTLFICAESLRRTRHDQLYYKMVADPTVPARSW